MDEIVTIVHLTTSNKYVNVLNYINEHVDVNNRIE